MVNINQSIRDEEEKESVFNILVEFGADVVPAIEEYLNRKDAASVPVTWPKARLDGERLQEKGGGGPPGGFACGSFGQDKRQVGPQAVE